MQSDSGYRSIAVALRMVCINGKFANRFFIQLEDKDSMSEFELRDKLKEERENIKSFDELISFLQNVKENCNYGYGAAPRAIAQAALATAWYLSSEFGITGFQASFVMWDFILDWKYRNNKCGLKMIE